MSQDIEETPKRLKFEYKHEEKPAFEMLIFKAVPSYPHGKMM